MLAYSLTGHPRAVSAPAAVPSAHVVHAAELPAAQPEVQPAAPHAAPARVSHTAWVGGELQIDFAALPLGEAVQMLAAATRSSVAGAEGLPAGGRPITMQWQGRSAAEAWHQLLAAEASYAARCSGGRCDIWVVPTAAAAASSVAGHAAPSAGPTVRAAAPAPSPPAQPGEEALTAAQALALEAFGESP